MFKVIFEGINIIDEEIMGYIIVLVFLIMYEFLGCCFLLGLCGNF